LELSSKPGVYLLLISVGEDLYLKTRRGREFTIPRGVYLYVGSARGVGGLKARVERHLNGVKKMHWHVDYLLASRSVCVEAVFYKYVENPNVDYEREVAREMIKNFDYIPEFGCSDKKSDVSHLYKCGANTASCYENTSKLLSDLGFTILVLDKPVCGQPGSTNT